jgi:hypothetical protein
MLEIKIIHYVGFIAARFRRCRQIQIRIRNTGLRIRHILVRIRMRTRILGSVPLSKNIRILRIWMRIRNNSKKSSRSHKMIKQLKSRFSLLFLLDVEGSRAGFLLVTNGSRTYGSYGCGSGSTTLGCRMTDEQLDLVTLFCVKAWYSPATAACRMSYGWRSLLLLLQALPPPAR